MLDFQLKKVLGLNLLAHFSLYKSIRDFKDGWMNGVLGHFYALSRLNWAGDNLGGLQELNSLASFSLCQKHF